MSKPKQQFKQAKINEEVKFSIFPFVSAKIAYIVLGIVGFAFYINTYQNEFALDDGIIIHKNEYVMKGAKGIKDVMIHDAYYSFYRQMNAEDQLAGGRYRPLSAVTFAIEQSFIRPYPTGLFEKYKDIDRNGVIDKKEYNFYEDRNNNGAMDLNECLDCWDRDGDGKMDAPEDKNGNGKLDQGEDLNDNKVLDLEGPEDYNDDGLVNDSDCQVEGTGLRHFNNMLFYTLSILVLFGFLKNYLFKNNPDLAFLTALIFCIHPIHTEVVANMKSRDEILSFLFIILTFIYTFKSLEEKKTKYFVLAGFMYFLALLSKEYAFTLVLIVPMMIYVFRPELMDLKNKETRLMLIKFAITFAAFVIVAILMYKIKEYSANAKFKTKKPYPIYILLGLAYCVTILLVWMKEFKNKTFVALFSSLTVAFIVYMCFRLYSVTLKPSVPDTEVLNNPYLFMEPGQKWATKIYVLSKYMKLLFVPHPLSADYSFNTILPRTFGSWDTLWSIVMHIGLALLTLWLFIKRHVLSFALIFYFANLLMVGNMFMDIGATMGERLIYHSSFGFAICIAWLLIEGLKKLKVEGVLHKSVVIGVAAILTAVFGYLTVIRNADWKNDITLFTHDVKTMPNSVLCLGNAGARWIDLSERPQNRDSAKVFVNRAVGYLKHALELHPTYVNGYLNLGLAQMKQEDFDGAYDTWKKAKTMYPSNPYLQSYFPYLAGNYMNKGVLSSQKGEHDEAVRCIERAAECNPNSYDVWYNYAGVYFTKGEVETKKGEFEKARASIEKAKTGFENCLKLDPNSQNAKDGLLGAQQRLGIAPPASTPVMK